MFPALQRLNEAKHILIAGCGGGFDVYAGVPIAIGLMAKGKQVVFANLSFTNLPLCAAEKIHPATWRIDRRSGEIPYFPEKWLCEWLARSGRLVPVYAFERSRPKDLASGYTQIISEHGVDLVLLIDGGMDSVIFGDEPGLGTVVEDAISVVSANQAAGESSLLASIGFGIDHYHGISHHSFLENTAQLIRDGGFLGAVSLTPGTEEADTLIELVDYANQRQPKHKSIVMNSLISALRGEFGDYHATDRTAGSELFINPLMTQFWFYSTRHLVGRMSYAEELMEAENWKEAQSVIEHKRQIMALRPRVPIPL